jgi:hypothetical protein
MMRRAVLALLLLAAGSCIHSKPQAQAGPRVWGLPPSADDRDLFCLVGIEQPQHCRTVGVVRDFMRSIQAQP